MTSESNIGVGSALAGKCHCGAIAVEAKFAPASLTQCNCSICHRYGTLWLHDQVQKLTVESTDGRDLADCVDAYEWGDRQLTFYRCANCGCVTHWFPKDVHDEAAMAINARMFPQSVLDGLLIKRLDGADTWEFLD